MARDPTAPAVVLSPHLDDAVLSCWSVLSTGGDVRVVNVLAGPPDTRVPEHWDVVCGARDAHAHWEKRIAEDCRALAQVAIRPVNLPFMDWQYRQEEVPPFLAALDRALTAAVPAASVVYAPATVGHRHPDHLLVRSYALRLLRAAVPVRLYADLPYCAKRGWPSWVCGASAQPGDETEGRWGSDLARLTEVGDPEAGEVTRLTSSQAADKRRALLCYATQFDPLDRAFPRVLTDPDLYGHEVFWTPRAGSGGRRRGNR